MNRNSNNYTQQQGDLQQNNVMNDEFNELLDNDESLNPELYEEETAAEFVDSERELYTERADENENHFHLTKNVYGWIAVALSILSFFIAPYVFGGAAIILGFIARNRDRVMLGNIAIVIGVISIIARFLFFRTL